MSDFKFRVLVVRDAIAAADRLEDGIDTFEGARRDSLLETLDLVREVLFLMAGDLRNTKPISDAEITALLVDAHENLRDAKTVLGAYAGDEAARAEIAAMHAAEHARNRARLRDLGDELGRLAKQERDDEPERQEDRP